MDIKDKLTAEEKQTFEDLRVEMLVLQNFLNEQAFENLRVELIVLQNLLNARRAKFDTHLCETLERLSYNPMSYSREKVILQKLLNYLLGI